jgi:hypothetical protein
VRVAAWDSRGGHNGSGSWLYVRVVRIAQRIGGDWIFHDSTKLRGGLEICKNKRRLVVKNTFRVSASPCRLSDVYHVRFHNLRKLGPAARKQRSARAMPSVRTSTAATFDSTSRGLQHQKGGTEAGSVTANCHTYTIVCLFVVHRMSSQTDYR